MLQTLLARKKYQEEMLDEHPPKYASEPNTDLAFCVNFDV